MPATEHPLVSIIIPCFNAERWIAEAIQSCLEQTYSSIELIVVDDGSDDGSISRIEEFDANVLLLCGPHRGGDYARNEGFAASSGTYIQFLDADDYLLPEKIERQVQCLEICRADAVYGDWQHQFNLPDGTHHLGAVRTSGHQSDTLEALLKGWWVSPAALLFRRSVVERVGGWDEHLQAAQDRDFFTRVALSGARIVYQPGCYSVYRKYGNITVGTSNRERWLKSNWNVIEKAEFTLAQNNQLSTRYKNALAESYYSIARSFFDIDRPNYEILLRKVMTLDPEFKPRESLTFNLVCALLGLRKAEILAHYKRRFITSLSDWSANSMS